MPTLAVAEGRLFKACVYCSCIRLCENYARRWLCDDCAIADGFRQPDPPLVGRIFVSNGDIIEVVMRRGRDVYMCHVATRENEHRAAHFTGRTLRSFEPIEL